MSEQPRDYAVTLVGADGQVKSTGTPKTQRDARRYAQLAVRYFTDVAESCVVSLRTGATLDTFTGSDMPQEVEG